ncbi:uncharacterized protein LOC100898580 [Galendromus occidentalis]|uniref:Uncharacterized protein LOC100898580 n=1 Tax=Galendromus occidentalis TaxID=34638 RepID=A0AAJ7SEJ3_9ACAR|nr:uncharacterized protein LOC100898580 [Galendromus occidentalis]
MTTFIAMQTRRVFRLGAPYPSSCSDDWTHDKLPSWVNKSALIEDYTPQLCLELCHSDALNKRCAGCVIKGNNISLRAAMDAFTFCSRNLSCAVEWLQSDGNFNCNCPQRCSETVVKYQSSFAAWSTEDRSDRHLVKVSIYFTTVSWEQVTEFPLMSSIAALTLVGGFLNMYVGLTFLSLYEFIEIGVFIYVRLKSKYQVRRGV